LGLAGCTFHIIRLTGSKQSKMLNAANHKPPIDGVPIISVVVSRWALNSWPSAAVFVAVPDETGFVRMNGY
jgi:hypothetical protein